MSRRLICVTPLADRFSVFSRGINVLFALWIAVAGSYATAADTGFVSNEKSRIETKWLEVLLGIDLHPASYALVVGVSEYENNRSFSNLPTENDPLAVKDYLIDVAGFDYVHLLTGEDVTEQRLKDLILSEFRSRVGPQDRLFIYWSGHGETLPVETGGETGFLAFADSQAKDPATMIEMNALRRWTDFVLAEQLLFVIDACFSGFAGAEAMTGLDKETYIEHLRRPSRQILTAGTENQSTFATYQPRGGVFTRAFLEGVSGDADNENNLLDRDGIVTVEELMTYFRPRILQERRRQNWNDALDPQLYKVGSTPGTFYFITPKLRKAASDYGKQLDDGAGAADSNVASMSGQSAFGSVARSTILDAQFGLQALGFAVGTRGELDRETETAILAFQALAGVPKTGRPDATTLAAVTRMNARPSVDLAALRDAKIEIRLVYQAGAETMVDQIVGRLQSAGVRYSLSEAYSIPKDISGRLYFGDNYAGAARSLRSLTQDVVDTRLSHSATAGNTLRLLISLDSANSR